MSTLKENAARVRSALLASVEAHPNAAIALSGGIDSASVLAAALALGRKPECFTFQLLPNESADLRTARSMCETFGLTLHVAKISRDRDAMVVDLQSILPYAARYLGQAYGSSGGRLVKVPVQCLHPMTHLHALARRYGVGEMLTGFCADTYYGANRSMSVMLREEGFAAWDAYRRKYLVHPVNADLLVKQWFADHGIDLIDAWAVPGVQDVMFSMTITELQKPFVKAPAVHAFPEFWSRGAWLRENQSLQVVGGIREWHDTLLQSPHNKGGHKTVVSVYADILKEMKHVDIAVQGP